MSQLTIGIPAQLAGVPTGGPWSITEPVGKLEAKYFRCDRPVCWKSLDYEVHRARSSQDPRWAVTVDGTDLMATHLMNSGLRDNESFDLIRRAPRIEAALTDLRDEDLGSVELAALRPQLLELFKAVRVSGVGVAKATKLLALKRPGLIPILDSQVITALYGRHFQLPRDEERFADRVFQMLERFQMLMRWVDTDVDNARALRSVTTQVQASIASYRSGFHVSAPAIELTPARVLESLLWFDWWGAGYYGYHWDREVNRVVQKPPESPPQDSLET